MPDEGFRMTYDGNTLRVYDGAGELRDEFPSTSGGRGSTPADQAVRDWGPIPAGDYSLDPQEFSEGGFLRDLLGDWGEWRAPLKPGPDTETLGRSDFFIHGGEDPGSAGCIDVGERVSDLRELLKDAPGRIPLTVDYGDQESVDPAFDPSLPNQSSASNGSENISYPDDGSANMSHSQDQSTTADGYEDGGVSSVDGSGPS